ncbi:MAG: dihydroneopterin aldolase [Pseudohongiellaceae bacterium]
MNDIIYIRELRVETIIGIHDHERKQKQTISIDIEMAADTRPAAASDNIKDALDYDAVVHRVTEFVEAANYQLIETLAEHIAQLILKKFKAPWLRLRVSKPDALPNAKDAGVVIERPAP